MVRLLALLVLSIAACAARQAGGIVVLISADAEWRALREKLDDAPVEHSAFGPWFVHGYGKQDVVFLHGGWGKVAAAASTQFAIDRFAPRLLVNLGTCGGFEGAAAVGDVILVNRTVVYDIQEAMGDSQQAIDFFSTELDVSRWPAGLRDEVVTDVMVSGDRDLVPAQVPELACRYRARAGDWESGAIAWTAARNRTPLLILRGVSDVVSAGGSPTYGDIEAFQRGARIVMGRLLALFARAVDSL